MVYQPKTMYFLNEPVRAITVDDGMSVMKKDMIRVIVKDCMDVLERVKKDGTWTDAKTIIDRALEDLGKTTDHESFVVCLGKDSLGRDNVQEVETLRLSVLPFIILQLRPTARKGPGALAKWQAFVRYVDNLLYQADAQDIIVREEKIANDEEYINSINQVVLEAYTKSDAAKIIGCIDGTELEKYLIQHGYIQFNKYKEIAYANPKYIQHTKKQYKIKVASILELKDELKSKIDADLNRNFTNLGLNKEV